MRPPAAFCGRLERCYGRPRSRFRVRWQVAGGRWQVTGDRWQVVYRAVPMRRVLLPVLLLLALAAPAAPPATGMDFCPAGERMACCPANAGCSLTGCAPGSEAARAPAAPRVIARAASLAPPRGPSSPSPDPAPIPARVGFSRLEEPPPRV